MYRNSISKKKRFNFIVSFSALTSLFPEKASGAKKVIKNNYGRVTSFTGGDGKSYSVLQTQGNFNRLDGIYEYVLDTTGKITHQRFIEGGKITGFPN